MAWVTPTSPSHSPFFYALGGYRGSDGVPPAGPTIDYELSKILPQTLLPHRIVDSIENMYSHLHNLPQADSRSTYSIQPSIPLLYGGISEGDIRNQHEARSSMLALKAWLHRKALNVSG